MMKKVVDLIFLDDNMIRCNFNNGEEKDVDLKAIIKDSIGKKVLEPNVFKKAKIGVFGEVYWEHMGEIRNLNGEIESCNYDISPELLYSQSKKPLTDSLNS